MEKIMVSGFIAITLLCSNSFGVIDLNDGGYHLYNYTTSQTIRLDFGFPGKGTIAEVQAPGDVYYLSACEDSRIVISGGEVYGVIGNDNNTITMTGGAVQWLHLQGTTQAIVSGGSIHALLLGRTSQTSTSSIMLIGTNFAIDGKALSYGQYFVGDFAKGTLTGTLQNGDALNCAVEIFDQSSVILIPEPAVCLLLAAGAVFVRKRR